jgi:hypothetical protein
MNEPSKHFDTPFGVHRLMKEPYDDREIFENFSALESYLNSTTNNSYTGQRGRVLLHQTSTSIPNIDYTSYIDFTIIDGYPIFDLKNNEYMYCGSDPKYMLIYKTDKTTSFTSAKNRDNYISLSHYDGIGQCFSILDTLPVIVKDTDTYSFLVEFNISAKYGPENVLWKNFTKANFRFSLTKDQFKKLLNRQITTPITKSDITVNGFQVPDRSYILNIESGTESNGYLAKLSIGYSGDSTGSTHIFPYVLYLFPTTSRINNTSYVYPMSLYVINQKYIDMCRKVG